MAVVPSWGRVGAVEIGVGTTKGSPGRYYGELRDSGPQIYIEGRLFFNPSWEVGLQLMSGVAIDKDDGYDTSRMLCTFFCDYNYLRTNNARFYVGVGLGGGYVDDDTLPTYYVHPTDDDEWHWDDDDEYLTSFNQRIFNPRFGVELWGRLNISVDWKLMAHGYSTLGLNVGILL